MSRLNEFSMADPEVASCPFDYYAAMRQEAPVHRDPGTGVYWITRYDDVLAASLNTEAFSSKSELVIRRNYSPAAQKIWDEAGMRPLDTLVTTDPPEHDDYRYIGMKLFTPKRVNEIAPYIESLVNELIDRFIDRGDVMFIDEFASRLPGTVVCDEFGLPREDQPQFRAWVDAVIRLINPNLEEAEEAELVKRMIAMFRYLADHLEKAAEKPSGKIIHTLATMPRKDGTPFETLERAWLTLVTFVGGNETTMNMLGSGLFRLVTDLELQEDLRQHPEKIAGFTEELLRLEASVQSLLRVATRDITLGGITIPKGANVALCTASANRDERRWQDADTLCPERSDARRHLTFGYGRHNCIGMHLARRELNIAFRTILERMQNIRLMAPDNPPQHLPLLFHRGLPELELRFERTGQ